jgi:hypothetical protein
MHQACRHGANDHRIGWSEGVEARCDVRGFPKRQVLVPPATPHHPHHDGAGVDTESHGELHSVLYCQTGIQGRDGLDNPQAGVHRTPGIVFMGHGGSQKGRAGPRAVWSPLHRRTSRSAVAVLRQEHCVPTQG